MVSDEEGGNNEEIQSAVRQKWEIIKPKGFDLIESDIGENTVQYLKQKADESVVSFSAQVSSYLCFCLWSKY